MVEHRAARQAAIDLAGLDGLTADSIALFVPEGARALAGVAGLVDWRLGNLVSRAQAEGHFVGRLGEQLIVPAPARLRHLTVLVVGLGDATSLGAPTLTRAATQAVAAAQGAGCRRLALAAPEPWAPGGAEGTLMQLAAATSAHIIVKVLTHKVE